MIEKVYDYKRVDEKLIEMVVDDDNLALNHMILVKDTGLPLHFSNSNVYMIIVRGTMTIALDEQEAHRYPAGQIINIPYHTKMDVQNKDDEILEFFVVKSPNPRNYGGK
jgi:quercetin dioxygenase-like cupin family protein